MLIIRFYQTERRRSPVEEFINGQPGKVTAEIYRQIKELGRYYPDTRDLDIKYLRSRLWELRVRAGGNRYRIVFSVIAGKIVFLDGFIKKRRREEHEIKLAEKRRKDYIQRFK